MKVSYKAINTVFERLGGGLVICRYIKVPRFWVLNSDGLVLFYAASTAFCIFFEAGFHRLCYLGSFPRSCPLL
jgi:hypothetical protein